MKNPRTKTLIAETNLMMRILMDTEDDEGCWLWKGTIGTTGHPIVHLRGEAGFDDGCHLVRRLTFQLNGGTLKPRQPLGCKCNNVLCVNPAHLFQSTISDIGKKAAAAGAWKGTDRAIRISMAKRAKAKLNIEIAREIRLSNEAGHVLGARHGVDPSLINSIKRGDIWKDYASPFARLGAR